MHYVNVLCYFPVEDKIFQGKIHANCLGGKPDGLADVDRNDSLLYVSGLEIKITSYF